MVGNGEDQSVCGGRQPTYGATRLNYSFKKQRAVTVTLSHVRLTLREKFVSSMCMFVSTFLDLCRGGIMIEFKNVFFLDNAALERQVYNSISDYFKINFKFSSTDFFLFKVLRLIRKHPVKKVLFFLLFIALI